MTTEREEKLEVSVIVASVESIHSIARCLDAIRVASAGIAAEILVIDASRDGTADVAEQHVGRARVIRCAPGTLTPELWAIGIARSTGRIVVLTTGHFVVEPSWIASLTSAFGSRVAGVGGRVDIARDATITDWAVFYLRYSELIEEPESVTSVHGIAADNAAYDGDAARRFVRTTADGFWEVEFHRQLRASGQGLAMAPGATGWFARSFPFATIFAHRFHHGRHAGAWRASHGGRAAPLIVMAAPAVPAVLAARVWKRVRRRAVHRARFVRSLPAFLVLAVAWAAGEAVGALTGMPASRRSAAAPA